MGDTVPRGGLFLRPALQRVRTLAAEGLSRLALRGVDRVGARPRVYGSPVIENLGTITIGDDFELRAGPVRAHLVTGLTGVLRIGDGVSIGAGTGIAASALVEIGDGAYLGPQVSILSTDYHVVGDFHKASEPTPISIGAHAWIGERVTVLRGAVIGRYARVEPGSVVTGVIPDGAHAAGVRARLIPRSERGVFKAQGGSPDALTDRILRVGAEVFALPALPRLGDGPAKIAAWDSLGALRLLVSLEEELGISLSPGALAGVRDFAEVRDRVVQAMDG